MQTARGRSVSLMSLTIALLSAASLAGAHCQIPCGIYDDEARIAAMREHVTTIEKSMSKIEALGKEPSPNWNQIVRWVGNKDQHADELAEIITYYFMAQRIKPPEEGADEAAKSKYAAEVGMLHRMLVHSMKAKQTTDTAHVRGLRKLIGEFQASYLGDRQH